MSLRITDEMIQFFEAIKSKEDNSAFFKSINKKENSNDFFDEEEDSISNAEIKSILNITTKDKLKEYDNFKFN